MFLKDASFVFYKTFHKIASGPCARHPRFCVHVFSFKKHFFKNIHKMKMLGNKHKWMKLMENIFEKLYIFIQKYQSVISTRFLVLIWRWFSWCIFGAGSMREGGHPAERVNISNPAPVVNGSCGKSKHQIFKRSVYTSQMVFFQCFT